LLSKIEAKIADFVKQTAEFTDQLKGEMKKWAEIATKMVSRGGLEPPTG
jgi:hypothetical protein